VHHGEGLRRLLTAKDVPTDERESLLAALQTDPLEAVRDEADRAMLAYADKLTRAPDEIDAVDIETLRDAGFDDLAIHDICAVVAYYAFVNRIADGLGVELEEDREE